MLQLLFQLFRQSGRIQKVPVTTINIPGASDTSPHFVRLQDIQSMFTDAHQFELNGEPIYILPEHDGTKPRHIAFYPGEIIDIVTDMPNSSKANTDNSNREKTEIPTSQDPLTSNEDEQQRIRELLLEAKSKDEKIEALQLEVKEKDDKTLELKLEAKVNADRMLALQLQAKAKDEIILQMQQTVSDRESVAEKNPDSIPTKTFDLYDYPIPRLFIILPKDNSKTNSSSVIGDNFRLFFLCECGDHTKAFSNEDTDIPRHIHLAKHEGYDIERPNEFLQKYGMYVLALLEMIKSGTTILGSTTPALAAIRDHSRIDNLEESPHAISHSDVDKSIEYLQSLSNDNSKHNDSGDDIDGATFSGQDTMEEADLLHLETFIKRRSDDRVLGNLHQVVTHGGQVKWVCLDHYRLTYKLKEEQVFTTAVQANKGFYDPELGQVAIKLESKTKAAQFFDTLPNARLVVHLDVTFDRECGMSELQILEDALKKSSVSILRLDLLKLDSRSYLHDLLLPASARYQSLFRITKLANMRAIHIVLPEDLVNYPSIPSTKPSHLRQLSFEMNPPRKTWEGGKGIERIAETLKTNSTITTLDFMDKTSNYDGKYIGDSGAKALSEALKVNSTLTDLIVSHSAIGVNGAEALSEALKINSTLTTLDLSSNRIGDYGAQVISEALKINSTLTTLSLGHNSIGVNGAQVLTDALILNWALASLDLRENSIGDNGARVISEALKFNSILTTLDLADNSIGESGAQALSEALKINSTLTNLSLRRNKIGDNGAKAISGALKINLTLSTLNLECSSIEDSGAQALSDSLKINSTLTVLHLGWNLIGDNGAQALVDALKINSTLTYIDLAKNSFGIERTWALNEAIEEQRRRVKSIDL